MRQPDAAGWRTYSFIFSCAALPRLFYLLISPRYFEYEYWEMGASLLRHGTLGFDGAPTTQFEPLYPLFVAALRALTGDRVLVAQAIQVAIGSLAAVCLFHLTESLTGNRRAAFIAAGLFAIYPLSVRHSADGSDITLMATLVIASSWMFIAAKTAAGAAMAGTMIGLAALTRTMALPLVALAALILLRERRPRAALALTAAALAVFAPYAVRNYSLNGAILPTRTGVNLLVSNSEYTQAVVPTHHADLLEGHAESLLVRDGIGSDNGLTPALERQQDVALRRYAWADMSRRPIELLSLRATYAFYFLGPFLIPYQAPGDEPAIELKEGGRVLITGYVPRPLWERAVYTASYTPLLALAVWALVQRRAWHPREAILWSVAATFVVTHSVFFPATRYRVPMDFVLLCYAAIGLDALASRWWPARQHAELEAV
jgi:4-amino-4-deoxy-L-arabinose transferase-like glycosyltransferase